MFDVALTFLADELNEYLAVRTGSSFGEAESSVLVDEGGKWKVPDDHLALTVVNLEEDRTFKAQLPEPVYVAGQHRVLPPDLKINVYLLVSAHFRQYDEALKLLALAMTFFQAHPLFTQEQYPNLDPRITKLVVELQSLGFEQLSQIWAFVGAKQLPSVVYKVKLVLLQDQEPILVGPPITTINALLHGV